ncbi:Aspartyl protease [Xanthomonas sp. GW]|uniref:retroviral-like aspartic protease family protein n=1 Tax=Xanthomonas sp. GW TaxID=2724121 RepID=UPI001639BE10|nr:retroviral-like aspartic protease family protein [Xanthomonas sp. GW]QNH21346.1 Aspartyl protease [Xanthomonas sp. GW]
MLVSPTSPNSRVYRIRPTASKLGACGLALIALLASAIWPRDATAEVAMTPGVTGHLLVPVFVNGKGPYEFMLDTGADTSAVYAWFASEQHLPSGKIATISGATGDVEETTTRVESLSLDGRAIHHLDVDTIPDRTDGVKIAGIVGADLLMDRITVMDTGCQTVSLLPRGKNAARLAGHSATLIEAGSIKNGKQLTLPVTVNGVAGVATLDSGARSSMINTTFANAAQIDPGSAAFRDGPPARGAVQTPIPSRIGPIGTVSFPGSTQRNVVARVVDLPVFDDAGYSDGHAFNIGVDMLQAMRITLDYSARRVWIGPSSCVATSGSR